MLSFAVRLYRFDRPLADWHSWRQADTASVTRIYVQEGIDLLRPRYHDLSSIPSGLDNPEGYRMVEFPLPNAIVAFLYKLTFNLHQYPVHQFSRLVSIGLSLISLISIYLIVELLVNKKTALTAASVFGFLPFSIFYSTAILPEVWLVASSLVSIYLFLRFADTDKKIYLFGFTVFASFSMLIKPTFLFLVPALGLHLFLSKGWKIILNPFLYLSGMAILAPFLLWRQWISQFPEGIPDFVWLLNSNDIRFKGAFFRWLFADRLGRLILGYWGIFPFLLGVATRPAQKTRWFFHWWLAGIVAYLTVFATGNVTHDYYQVITLPIISILLAIGLTQLTSSARSVLSRRVSWPLAFITVLFITAFGWYEVRGFFNINNPAMVAAGKAADELLPKDAKVIVPYGGDTAFLYQTNRSGWPIGGDIQEKVNQGASYYITTSLDDEASKLLEVSQVVAQTPEYLILDLPDIIGSE